MVLKIDLGSDMSGKQDNIPTPLELASKFRCTQGTITQGSLVYDPGPEEILISNALLNIHSLDRTFFRKPKILQVSKN